MLPDLSAVGRPSPGRLTVPVQMLDLRVQQLLKGASWQQPVSVLVFAPLRISSQGCAYAWSIMPHSRKLSQPTPKASLPGSMADIVRHAHSIVKSSCAALPSVEGAPTEIICISTRGGLPCQTPSSERAEQQCSLHPGLEVK